MALIKKDDKEARRKVLRDFGLVMTLALSVIGGILLWGGSPSCLYLFTPASFFLICAIFAPDVLEPLERVWMKFADKLNVVVTAILMTLTFYLMITPIGLIMRLLGKDLLSLKLDPEKDSYWVPVEEDAPGTRPFLPY